MVDTRVVPSQLGSHVSRNSFGLNVFPSLLPYRCMAYTSDRSPSDIIDAYSRFRSVFLNSPESPAVSVARACGSCTSSVTPIGSSAWRPAYAPPDNRVCSGGFRVCGGQLCQTARCFWQYEDRHYDLAVRELAAHECKSC